MTLQNQLTKSLDSRKQRSLFRKLKPFNESLVDFSSNDFLSLRADNKLKKLFLEELKEMNYIGSGGSRLLDGNSEYAEELENAICVAHNACSGLLFNSGYDANTSVLSTIPQPGDIIIYDEYIHASIHNGMKLSRSAKKVSFDHNSVKSLEQVLKDELEMISGIRSSKVNVFIVVETVYSMDGDICPLAEILHVVKSLLPMGNGYIIVDEAHATGVIGLGLVSHLNLEKEIFIRMHTFGKALACNGVRDYLINYSKPFIYSTAQGFHNLAAIKSSYRLILNKDLIKEVFGKADPIIVDLDTNKKQSYLQENISYLHYRILEMGIVNNGLIRYLAHGPVRSSIFSLICSYPRQLAAKCEASGFMVRPIVSPTVPKGKERLRICIHAGNTKKEIDTLLNVIATWVYSFDEKKRPIGCRI